MGEVFFRFFRFCLGRGGTSALWVWVGVRMRVCVYVRTCGEVLSQVGKNFYMGWGGDLGAVSFQLSLMYAYVRGC